MIQTDTYSRDYQDKGCTLLHWVSADAPYVSESYDEVNLPKSGGFAFTES